LASDVAIPKEFYLYEIASPSLREWSRKDKGELPRFLLWEWAQDDKKG